MTTTNLIEARHPRNANVKWPRYVKLAAHSMDIGPRTDARMLEILQALAEQFPDAMKPILAKWDGGVSALRQRLNHMYTPGYENEHPDIWPDLELHHTLPVNCGWYHRELLSTRWAYGGTAHAHPE